MKKIHITIVFHILFIGLTLTSCTTYQTASKGFTGGYTDIPADYEDIVGVRFSGNGFTPGSAVNTFMLMRIADLAIQRGYKNFYLVDSSQNVETSLNSYTYNRTQTSSSNVSGWVNGNYYTGRVDTTYSVPTTQYYTVSKASSGGVAVFTNERIEELAGKPYYNAQTVYNEGLSLNNRYKFWNYTQIGYTYANGSPLGFQYGILGGWLYGTFNFYLNEPNFKGHNVYEYISPSYSDTFTGDTLTTKSFSFTVGSQIPIIKNILSIPVGIGMEFMDNYKLYDEHYTFIDSYTWYKTESTNRMILEVGLMGRWKFLYGQGVFRLIGFNEPSFAVSAGVVFDEL